MCRRCITADLSLRSNISVFVFQTDHRQERRALFVALRPMSGKRTRNHVNINYRNAIAASLSGVICNHGNHQVLKTLCIHRFCCVAFDSLLIINKRATPIYRDERNMFARNTLRFFQPFSARQKAAINAAFLHRSLANQFECTIGQFVDNIFDLLFIIDCHFSANRVAPRRELHLLYANFVVVSNIDGIGR
ncbi:Uncharacterised protein [Escherichia coli]|nr:Uncharacterised protein [Escherichia coli]CTW75216.1 Uncharacterised protein [Escherichia coli]CTW88537.1 Uncharacterised protein [Escherichia coli]